jgi:selenide,water dikinase
MEDSIKLTQYSKGSGCGCKIPASQLDIILSGDESLTIFKDLLVGNNSRDDAAVLDLGNGNALISTTDFFTPIVDDAYDFGRIASVNAINDIYAMGGKPVLAIAILGWNMDKLPAELAQKVIQGSRAICEEAGIPLAGGHSISTTEPIFGLAVNGIIPITNLKMNNTAKAGDLLFLTKPLGIGIISAALKRGIVKDEDYKTALKLMSQLNIVGQELGKLKGVSSMTDVTGFGLLGHLIEMADGSNLTAELDYPAIPLIKGVEYYSNQFCFPDNVYRNWNSYEKKVKGIEGTSFITLCDPQTSGGLLIAIHPESLDEFNKVMKDFQFETIIKAPIGKFISRQEISIQILDGEQRINENHF